MLLEEFLRPLGLTQTDVAERMQVPLQRLNAIIRGRKAVTPDTALRLERLFGMEAQFWLNLQQNVDLYRAMYSPTAADISANFGAFQVLTPTRTESRNKVREDPAGPAVSRGGPVVRPRGLPSQ